MSKQLGMGQGVGIGADLGAGIGATVGNLAIGIAIGVALGAALTLERAEAASKEDTEDKDYSGGGSGDDDE